MDDIINEIEKFTKFYLRLSIIAMTVCGIIIPIILKQPAAILFGLLAMKIVDGISRIRFKSLQKQLLIAFLTKAILEATQEKLSELRDIAPDDKKFQSLVSRLIMAKAKEYEKRKTQND